MDINWALTSSWRGIFVQLFNTQEKIDQLNASKTVEISYNNYKTELLRNSEIQALYLQAWLASQLNWKFIKTETAQGKRFFTYKNDHNILITLYPGGQQDVPPGAILEVTISTKDDHVCSISRKQKLSQVVVYASTLEKCELPFTLPLPNIHRGFGFMKEIFYHTLSDHYRHMLEIIAQVQPAC
jgi:glucose-6-phosphate dehydrogenase assembly protein OpcA